MKKEYMCIRGGGFWALAGAIAVSLPAAFTPAVTAQCNPGNPDPSPICDGQLGILGNFEQLCNDILNTSDDILENPGDTNDGWTGMAFPFFTNGAMVDAVTFTLNTNRAGGDIWILGNDATVTDPPTCGQPDINNVLAVACCALDGLVTFPPPAMPAPVTGTVSFTPFATSAAEPTWVVFVGRTGLAGVGGHDIDGDGTSDVFFFNGSTGTSHQPARDCSEDVNGDCTTPSAPGQAFANLAGTGIVPLPDGAPPWTDLDTIVLGGQAVGTPYCVNLTLLGLGDDNTNCINNAPATVVCCLDTKPTGECIAEVPWKCGQQGGVNGPPSSICFFNPFGECSCGPQSGNCTDPLGNGTKGCELVICCGVVCGIDPPCCSFEWDANCAFFAADFTACILCQDAANCQIANAVGNGGFISQSSDVNADPPTAHADNFVPEVGGLITETCWWGFYANAAGDDCSGAFVGPDAFTVTYYLNDPVGGNPGIPGAVHAVRVITAANLDKQPTARLLGGAGFAETIFNATHAAVPVNAGQCYWMEVTNNTSGEADCLWFWQTAPFSDGYSADGPAPYDPLDIELFDMAMCVGIALAPLNDEADPPNRIPTDCITAPNVACDAAVNSCGETSVTGGCSTPECCGRICTVDPNCCDIAWDQDCVALAATSCVALPCAGIDLSCATVTEPELCGADVNGGCNIGAGIGNFTVVTSGDIVAGKAYADGGTRDTDWYWLDLNALVALDVNGDGLLRVCVNVVSELPIVSFFIQDELQDCMTFTFPGGTAYAQTCAPAFGNDSLELAIDIYYVFAGTGTPGGGALFDGFPCGAPAGFGDNYMMSFDVLDNDGTVCPGADAVTCITACPWDCQPGAPSGAVDVPDLLALLAVWNIPGASPCDFTGDDIVNVPDLLKLLANWGPCPL